MKKNLFTSIYLILGLGHAATAQTVPTYDYFKIKEPLIKSSNAALLRYISLPLEGENEIGAYYKGGDFRSPYSSKSTQGINFSSSRYQRLNDWTFYGHFNFQSSKDKELGLSAHTDPYRDNPYQLIDSLSADWKKQKYGLQLQVATPAFANDRMNAGLYIQYDMQTGARQKDPRPLDNSSNLSLSPSITYKLDDQNIIGLTAHYLFYKEDLSIETVGNNRQFNLYRLLGAGEYQNSAPYIFTVGYNRTYEGRTWGGAVDYIYRNKGKQWTVNFDYRNGYEDVTDGSIYLQQAGKHAYAQYQASSFFDWKINRTSHQIGVEWTLKDMDNTEYHQVQNADTKKYETVYSSIMSTMLKNNTRISYLLSKERSDGQVDWWLKSTATYHNLDNRYANPKNKQLIDKMNVDVSFDKRFPLSNKKALSFQLKTAYDFLIHDEILYTDKSYSSNFVAHEVFIPMHDYNKVNTWTNGAHIKYNLKPIGKRENQLYIKASGLISTAMKDSGIIQKGDNRYMTQLTIGINTF